MDVFRAICDPTRRALLARLAGGPARVVDLASGHDMSRPAVSKHLRVLVEAGLVHAETVGRERHYALDVAPLDQVSAFLHDLESAVAQGASSPEATPAPPFAEHLLDGLDLEVRRVGRDRRPDKAAAQTRHTREGTA